MTTEGFAAQEPNPEPVDPVTRTGLRFDAAEKEYVQVQGAVDIPDTVEAWVKLDPNVNSRQIVMNNYGQGGTTWGLEVTTSNTLRYWDQADPNINLYFDEINVCTGQWMLISVVRDKAANTVKAYINGELKGEQSVSGFGDAKLTSWLCFGSDYHSNPIYLNGEISEVRMWSDVRTAEEIKAYYTQKITGKEDGLAMRGISPKLVKM